MKPAGVLVAGLGNIFRGDDGFGVEVAHRLMAGALPDHVRVFDCGTRGLDLLYAILDGPLAVILVDTAKKGHSPGTLYKMLIDLADFGGAPCSGEDAHAMNPFEALRAAAEMGVRPRILMIACEPEDLGSEDVGRLGMTPAVEAAVEPAADMIESLLMEWPAAK